MRRVISKLDINITAKICSLWPDNWEFGRHSPSSYIRFFNLVSSCLYHHSFFVPSHGC
uniref:Uncharacterized protein n=1 Tax=Helianthus annuus TaxID=4232 RepID=A0A251VT30_HELAN